MKNHESINEYVERFFKEHQVSLSQNYPGINYNRLRQELEVVIYNFFTKIKNGVPLAYISGQSYFYNSEFEVNSHVLIPRYETEILVEMALKEINKMAKEQKEKLQVVDLGTGCGAIIISLLQEISFGIDAFALDIDQNALSVAHRNYLNAKSKISSASTLTFIESDRFFSFKTKQHLIITNPPYIKEREDAKSVHHSVLKFEPHRALFLKDELYNRWFEELFIQALDLLYDGGVFLMEGHENHLMNLTKSMEQCGFCNITIHQDLTKRDRFIKAYKN